jgi:signal transduction histidine kinase
MRLKDAPIQRKLLVIILLTTITALLLMHGTLLLYEFLRFQRTTTRQLSTVGKIIAGNSTAALAFANQSDAREILSALNAERYVTAAALYDKEGKLFSKYPANLPDDALPATAQKDGFQSEHSYLAGCQPVMQGEKRLGTLYLRFDVGTLNQEWLRISISIALAVIAVVILVAYLLSIKLQKRISEPILALAGTAKAVYDRQDYSVRAKKFGEDEVGLLTDAFNQMLHKLEEKNTELQVTFEQLRVAHQEILELNRDLEGRVEQRTAELKTVNKELEAFSYSVSHDLRAPLRHIDGFLELLQKKAGTALDPKCLRYVNLIAESAKEMGTLIDNLLSFSRMGRAAMCAARVDLEQLVRNTIKELEQEAAGRDIVWKIGALPQVHADQALLRQVLINLISNALKYSRTRPRTEIEIGCPPDSNGEHVVFIRDNGVGFDMKYAEKLFGVFQRLHEAGEFEGTGIGLANVQRIIGRHGGRTWAEGVVDAGATFYFSLPKSPSLQNETQTHITRGRQSEGHRALARSP